MQSARLQARQQREVKDCEKKAKNLTDKIDRMEVGTL